VGPEGGQQLISAPLIHPEPTDEAVDDLVKVEVSRLIL